MPYTVQPSSLPECSIISLQTNPSDATRIPCYPDDITMSISGSWNDTQAIGRSTPITAYNGTSFAEYNFTLIVHRDMCEAMGISFDTLLYGLYNTVYAKYGEGANYGSPLTMFIFGEFQIEGGVTQLNMKYTKPIDAQGRYMCAEIGISIKGIPNVNPEYGSVNLPWRRSLGGPEGTVNFK